MPKHVFSNGRIDPRDERIRDKQRRAGYLISNILNDRIDIAETLSYEKHPDKEIEDSILQLKSEDPAERITAVETIGKADSPAILGYIIESLDDESADVRKKAAVILKEKAIQAYKNEEILTISQLLVAAKKLADLESQALKSNREEKEISDALDTIIKGH